MRQNGDNFLYSIILGRTSKKYPVYVIIIARNHVEANALPYV